MAGYSVDEETLPKRSTRKEETKSSSRRECAKQMVVNWE